LWKALWPGELSPNEYAVVAKELGLARIPSKAESLVPLYRESISKRMSDWLIQQAAKPTPESTEAAEALADANLQSVEVVHQEALEQSADEIFDQALSRPWTSAQIPPFAQWVNENQKPLDLLVEASRRPRCYFPSTSLINNQNETILNMSLSGVQGSREVSRSLPARAMWHLGEGRSEEAWQDLLAVHRIARLVAQGHTLVEQLVAIAIDGVACNGTQTLLHHGNLTTEQLQQIRRDLAALPPFAGMAPALDQGERLVVVDLLVHFAATRDMSWSQMSEELEIDPGGAQVFQLISVDWNLVLRNMNRWYDRLAAAARLPDRPQREVALDRIQADLQTLMAESRAPASLVASAVSRRQRSEVVAAIMLGLFMPAVHATINAQDRANTALQLTQLAAALAEYRAVHGAYPDKLDDLVPGVLDKVPVDIHNALPFFYKRDGEGYLLYSAGDNGADDGGSNEQLRIHAGQPLDSADPAEVEVLQSKIPAGSDDFSIRLPRQPFKLPKVAPNADGP
jgi:hypothetical protein